MRRHKLDWDNGGQSSMLQWTFGSKNVGSFLPVWGPVGFSRSTVLYHIALTGQCRLSEGRKQFFTELTAVPSVTGSTALFLQSTFRFAVRSFPSVNIPLSSPLCSFIQHSAFQSALFLQSTFRFQVRSVPSFNIPLSSPLCSFIQHSALQSALFLQSTVRSVPSVNIPLSSSLCSFSQHSALQSALLRHIKQITLSVSRSYKHRPSSLHQTPTVTSPAFHCEGLRSTPSRFMYEPWCSNSSTNCLQWTGLNFTSHSSLHLLRLCVSDVSSCQFTVQTVRYCYCTVISSHFLSVQFINTGCIRLIANICVH